MREEDKNFEDELASLSDRIDGFIADGTKYPSHLDDIEKWLLLQKERINMMKLPSHSSHDADMNNGRKRVDGTIIFDSILSVVNYSGPRNYFFGSDFDSNKELSLTSFFSEADIQTILETLSHSHPQNENPQIELSIKTGLGTSAMAMVELVPFPARDSYTMALLRFPKDQEQLLFTYQNILLDSLPGMDIYLFDHNYRFIIVAGQEKQRHGFSNSNMVGKTLFEVVDKKTQRSLFPFYNKALNGIETEGEIRFKDQVYYVIARPVQVLQNEGVAGIVIIQNVTSEKLQEQQLLKRKDEALESDRTKSIFIANLSHEMRTPLNAIMGFSDQLNKTELSDHQSNMVSLTRTASNHLLYLVNEVVFLFKLGMGKVYIENKPFSLNELIREIKEIMLPKADEKQLTFSIKYDGNCPDLLIGDPFRLRQILINLLVNAIKFTDEGSISLICTIQKPMNDQVLVDFEVQDTGIGIKKEHLSTVFDVFEQGEVRAENRRGGAGLGLGICQRLTTLLKGEITVESKLGAGSTFTVTIPFGKATNQSIPAPARKYAISDNLLVGKKIFLADDDQHNLILSELIFKGWKVDFKLASDGTQASQLLSNQKFDAIFLDIQMPGKTGLEIVEFIRSKPAHPNYSTPIISISANVLKSDIHHYLESGFNDYLTKPFREEEMYNVLCGNIVSGAHGLLMNSPEQAAVVSALDEINLQQLRKTAAGDKTFEKTILQNFRDQSFVLSTDFNVELLNQNWKKIGEKAHKAIPSFKYFGLGQTVFLLEKIEQKTLREKDFSNLHDLIKQSSRRISQLVEQFDQLLDEIKNEG